MRVTQYQTQLQNLLNKRNEDLEKLIVSLKGVIDQVGDTMLISFILHFSALQKCNFTCFFFQKEATKAADIRLKIDYISKDKSSALNLQTVSKKEKLEKKWTLVKKNLL